MKDYEIVECTAKVLVDSDSGLNKSTILDWSFPLRNPVTKYDDVSKEWALDLSFAVLVKDPSKRKVYISGIADCSVRIPQTTIDKGPEAWMPKMLHEALHHCSKAVQEDIKPIEVTGHMPWPVKTDDIFFMYFIAHYDGPVLFGRSSSKSGEVLHQQ